jgi:hypothetical protein
LWCRAAAAGARRQLLRADAILLQLLQVLEGVFQRPDVRHSLPHYSGLVNLQNQIDDRIKAKQSN